MRFDTLYFWSGGRERGQWREVLALPEEFEQKLEELKRAGFVAFKGKKSVGPPEGPPAEHHFKSLGL